MLGYFNNWRILKLSHQATFSEEIDKIHQVVLDGISKKMDELVQTGQYGDINTTYTSTMGYYVIKFVSEPYTLQGETMFGRQISTSVELVFKSQYMDCMKDNTEWCWEQKPQQNNTFFPIRTIVHTCLDATTITKVKIPKIVCNKVKHAMLYK